MTSSRALGVLLSLSWSVAAGELHLYEAVESHMGTLIQLKLYAAGPEQAKAAFRGAFDRIAQLDEALSDYKPESELNRLCRTAVARPVAVSDDLLRVLAASQRLAEDSAGAFDVTLGPLIRLWRQARQTHRLPDAEALREAAARSGYRKLHLDPAARTASLDQPGMQLDLGGIAKGYAADEALAVLVNSGIRRALVAVSGDIACGDPPPGQRGWRVGIDAGDRTLELANQAVSTSGDREQYIEIDGKRYSHILDPATGLGLIHAAMVTVVARRGIDADGLATAASVLGPERGMALIEKSGGRGLMVIQGKAVTSAGWQF